MTNDALPEGVRLLLARHLPSMDHVAALVALHTAPGTVASTDLATYARLTPAVADVVLSDLTDSRVAVAVDGGFQLNRQSAHAAAIEQVVELYHVRPVTLVRAVYERPAGVARSFADAFRVRKPGD